MVTGALGELVVFIFRVEDTDEIIHGSPKSIFVQAEIDKILHFHVLSTLSFITNPESNTT
jgi:hypothetical protein